MRHVAIVLGGGLRSDGTLPKTVSSRVEIALSMQHDFNAIIFSSRYTLNRPQKTDKKGHVIYEAKAMLDYFQSQVTALEKTLILDLSSTDTIGSALFTRSQLEAIGWRPKQISVITSGWHIERARAIFLWAYSLKKDCRSKYQLNFLSDNLNTSIERQTHEQVMLAKFYAEWRCIDSLDEAWQKLFFDHTNYNFRANSSKLFSNKDDY